MSRVAPFMLLAALAGGFAEAARAPSVLPGVEPGLWEVSRDATGRGQQIDVALLDTQVAWLVYEGMNYLVGGQVPTRRGNGHPNIVPYNVFPCADGHIILGIGNDGQFRKFCEFAGHATVADDPRFRTNPQRLANRDACDAAVGAITKTKPRQHWLDGLAAAGVPCSPILTMDAVVAEPQTEASGILVSAPHPRLDNYRSVGLPITWHGRRPTVRRVPPTLGEHSEDVLTQLGYTRDDVRGLRARGVVH